MATPLKKKQLFNDKCLASPVARSIAFREIYYFGDGTLHRSSFHQIWTPSKDKGVSSAQVTFSKFEVPNTSNKRNYSHLMETEDRKPKKIKKEKMPYFSQNLIAFINIFVWTLSIGILAIYPYHYHSSKKTNIVWPLFNLEGELTTSLFGQDTAIEKLIEVIDIAVASENPSAIALTGPPGVGKSYAASIVQAYFPFKQNVHLTTVSQDLSAFEKLKGWNLLIVEDCDKETIEPTISRISLLLKRATQNHTKIIVLVICRSKSHTDLTTFAKLLSSESRFFNIPFSTLDHDSITKCFYREMERHGINIPAPIVSRMVDERLAFTKNREIVSGPGCKNVEVELAKFSTRKINNGEL